MSRRIPLFGPYEIVLLSDELNGVVGDIEHVLRRGSGALFTPAGHFVGIRRPALPEQAAHWRVEAYLRDDMEYVMSNASVRVNRMAPPPHYPPELPDRLADVLLRETVCVAPLVVNVLEGRNTAHVTRGQVFETE